MSMKKINIVSLLFFGLFLISCGGRNVSEETSVLFSRTSFSIDSHNVTYLGNFRHLRDTRYSSIWGYTDQGGREYAILGVYDGTSIIDITDAPDLKEVSFIPATKSKWREIKVYQNFAYVVNETSGGMDIIDLAQLPSSARKVATFHGFSTSHTLSIDEARGFLYAEGDSTEPVRVYSLQNPLAPEFITSIGLHDNHDMYAIGNRVYLAEGHTGNIAIYDATDVTNMLLLKRFSIPDAGFVHNVWPTDDGNYLFSTEENLGKTVKVWDIRDLNNVTLIGEYLGPNRYAHNVHVKGNRAYLAHYRSGLRILDISDPTNPLEEGHMQKNITSSGAWGVFPYFNSGKVIVSDIEEGLFVVEYRP